MTYQHRTSGERVEAVRIPNAARVEGDLSDLADCGDWFVVGNDIARFVRHGWFTREYVKVEAEPERVLEKDHPLNPGYQFRRDSVVCGDAPGWWTNPLSGKTFCKTCQCDRLPELCLDGYSCAQCVSNLRREILEKTGIRIPEVWMNGQPVMSVGFGRLRLDGGWEEWHNGGWWSEKRVECQHDWSTQNCVYPVMQCTKCSKLVDWGKE